MPILGMSTTIQSLPQEILLKIFSFLQPYELWKHVSNVCLQWRRLAYDCSLWHKLALSTWGSNMSGFELCKIILHVSSSVQQLELHGMQDITPAEMAVVAENCPGLTHLNLGFISSVNRVMINAVLSTCPHLQYLNVEGCRNVNHEIAREIVNTGLSLTRLNFSHCPLVDESLLLLSQQLPCIKALNIDGISWISNRAIQELVQNHSSTLEELELDGAELTDVATKALAHCQNLTSLSISFCELLTDASLYSIQMLPALQKLCLRKGQGFTANGLAMFLSSLNLKSLHHLDLSECASLQDNAVQAVTQQCGSCLKTLNLSWCWDVTDVGLTAIVDKCSRLKELHLVGLHRVMGSCLDRIPEEMPCLKHMDLQQCNLINDAIIEDAVRRKPDLVVLNYYGEMFVHQQH